MGNCHLSKTNAYLSLASVDIGFLGVTISLVTISVVNIYNSDVRLSICPSVCPGLLGQTVSPRILQLGTFDQHDKRKMPIVFQGEVIGQGHVVTGKVIGRIQNEP